MLVNFNNNAHEKNNYIEIILFMDLTNMTNIISNFQFFNLIIIGGIYKFLCHHKTTIQ